MIQTKSIEGIIFLQYLTNYSIPEINAAFKINDLKTFIEEYCAFKKANDSAFNDKRVDDALIHATDWLHKMKYYDIKAISIFDDAYPSILKKIKKSPPIIYYKGNISMPEYNAAVIGSRKVSAEAYNSVNQVVEVLNEKKYGIISGLALGIDALAHEAAVKLNAYTLAVLPNSLDTIYPKQHYRLANDILDNGGAIISEIPIGINRGKLSFVERNRIQSGLSDVVIPIEMGVNSGTMHTVRYCIDQNKKLFVKVPPVEIASNEEFEGILLLISNQQKHPYNKLRVFDDADSLKSLLQEGYQTNLTLF